MLPFVHPPVAPPAARSAGNTRRLVKASRPALIDLRFKGDLWVVAHGDTAVVCLGDFPMGELAVSPFDVPALNHVLQAVRLGQARLQYRRQLHRLVVA